MKKLLMLIIGAGLAFAVKAQEVKMTNPNGAAVDTFNNTTAEGPYVRVSGETAKTVSFTIELTSSTGTVAGKIYLQGASRSGKWAFPYLDSVTLAPGSNNWQLSAVDPKFQYYRLWVVPTGTQLTIYQAYAYIRKP